MSHPRSRDLWKSLNSWVAGGPANRLACDPSCAVRGSAAAGCRFGASSESRRPRGTNLVHECRFCRTRRRACRRVERGRSGRWRRGNLEAHQGLAIGIADAGCRCGPPPPSAAVVCRSSISPAEFRSRDTSPCAATNWGPLQGIGRMDQDQATWRDAFS